VVKLGEHVLGDFEVVFVVDGSPDRVPARSCGKGLPALPLRTKLLSLSRNFALSRRLAAGMEKSWGDCIAVMAADLQETARAGAAILEALASGRTDIVFGVRGGRSDPWPSEIAVTLFWYFYRKFVIKDIPPGGVMFSAAPRPGNIFDHELR